MIMIKAELFMNRHRVVLWRWLWGGDPGVLWESVVVRGVADSSDRDLVHSPRSAPSLAWLRLWGGGVSGGGEGDPDHSVSQVWHRAQAVQAHLAGVALPPLVGLKVKDLFYISEFWVSLLLTWELMAVRAWAFRISLALSLFNILFTLFSIGFSLFFRFVEPMLLIIVLQVTEHSL